MATEEEINALYDKVDDALLAGDFACVDGELSQLDPATMDHDLVLGWLTITAAAADLLSHYGDFSRRSVQASKAQGWYEEGLFSGLCEE